MNKCWGCHHELKDLNGKYFKFGLGPVCGQRLVEDEWFEVIENKMCILCRKEKATTVEHPLKSSIIKQNSDGGEQMLISGLDVKRFTNPKSGKGKRKDLCEGCNTSVTQQSDKFFDEFYKSFNNRGLTVREEYLQPFSNYSYIEKKIDDELRIDLENRKLNKQRLPSAKDLLLIRNSRIMSQTLLDAGKYWYKLDHLTKLQLNHIKQYGAKGISCSLNRSDNPVPKELSDYCLQSNKDIHKIKVRFSKTCIKEYQDLSMGIANLQSGYKANGDCLLVQSFNGFILEFYYSKDGNFSEINDPSGYY